MGLRLGLDGNGQLRLFGRKPLQGLGDGVLVYVHGFPRQGLVAFDRLGQRLQVDGLDRREQRRLEGRVVDEGRPAPRVLIRSELLAAARDLDAPRPEEDGQNEPEHVALPAVADAAELPFQGLPGAGFLIPVAMLAHQVVEHFLGNVSAGVWHKAGAVLNDEPQALLARIEDLRQGLEIGRLQDRSQVRRPSVAGNPFRVSGRDRERRTRRAS